ncbi:hypothetical protein SAMN05216428_102433 [Nitrosospira sp. Nsp11]|nr:hypothetical protein [Nitrosospira sp. Nsp11]SHL44677.1 hypothetical protein SAMN05216428_102433 [Nitrosospira sp. Nsp11]
MKNHTRLSLFIACLLALTGAMFALPHVYAVPVYGAAMPALIWLFFIAS